MSKFDELIEKIELLKNKMIDQQGKINPENVDKSNETVLNGLKSLGIESLEDLSKIAGIPVKYLTIKGE